MQRVSKSKVRAILKQELALKEPRFELEDWGGQVCGSVISPSFRKKTDSRRQMLIRDALDDALGVDRANSVGMILAYTPEEWDSGTEFAETRGSAAKR